MIPILKTKPLSEHIENRELDNVPIELNKPIVDKNIPPNTSISYLDYMDNSNLYMKAKQALNISINDNVTTCLNAIWNKLGLPDDQISVDIAIDDFISNVKVKNNYLLYKGRKMSLEI